MIVEIYISLSLLMEAFICWVAWKLLRIEKAEARKAGFEEMREKIRGDKKTKILEWIPKESEEEAAAKKVLKELEEK